MSFGGDKNKIYSCPYDATHKVRGDRFLNHTTRCARKANGKLNQMPVAEGRSLPAPIDTEKISFLTKGEKEQQRRLALEKFKLDNPEAVNNSKRIFLEAQHKHQPTHHQKQGKELPKHNTKQSSNDVPSSSKIAAAKLIPFDSPSTTKNVQTLGRWGPGFDRNDTVYMKNLMD